MRVVRGVLLGILGLLALAAIGLFAVLPRVNLAGLVADRASAALGQPVAIETLHLSPGAWLGIAARGVTVGDGLAKIAEARAEVALASLLHGSLHLRGVTLSDAALALQPGPAATPGAAPGGFDLTTLPHVDDATLRQVSVTWRGGSGAPVTAKIASLALAAPGPDGHYTLQGEGSLNEAPVTLAGSTEGIPTAAQPAKATLKLEVAGNRLDFDGSVGNPRQDGGVAGKLALAIPSLPAAAKLIGAEAEGLEGALNVTGTLGRQDGAWRLAEVTGDLAGATLKAPFIQVVPSTPPRVTADLELSNLDVGKLYGGLGRRLTVARLKVAPGDWLRVEVQGVRLGNIPGGTRPDMVTLGRASLEADPASLLAGPPTLRKVVVEDFSLLLEKDRQRRRNWRFGKRANDTGPAPANAPPDDRSTLPLIQDAVLRRAEIVVRTTGGTPLTTKIEEFTLAAPTATARIALKGRGTWQGTPVTLDVTGEPTEVLRKTATPYPAAIRIGSGRTELDFTGTFADPLNVEGARGRLTLKAPSVEQALKLAGLAEASVDATLELEGQLEHRGDLWRLTQGHGQLAGSPVRAALLELVEGASGRPDAVKVDLAIERLDLNRMLRSKAGDNSDADLPLFLDPNPDPRVEAKLQIGELAFHKLRASRISLDGGIEPNGITLRELALTAYTARVTAQAQARPARGGGAQVNAQVQLVEGELEALRLAFGLRPLPVTGLINGRVVVAAQGQRVVQAAGGADISAVISLTQGSIAREILKYSSQDLSLVFNRPTGMVPMSCLLAVANIRAGIGEAAPIRLRTAEGTLSGVGSFDIWRSQMDVLIGTDPSTTGTFALDIPVRIWGSFDNPSIRPASWSAEGRAKLGSAYAVARVPPALRQYAERNPCFTLTGPAAAPPQRRR